MPQGNKTPIDVQWIVTRLTTIGKLSKEEVANCVGISTCTVERILKYYTEHGTLEPSASEQQQVAPSRSVLSDLDVQFLITAVQEIPDTYLDELREMLQDQCGVNVSVPTIWRALKNARFTMKKTTRVVLERSEEKQLEYMARIGHYHPDQLVFIDESSVDCRTSYRGCAWSLQGTPAQ